MRLFCRISCFGWPDNVSNMHEGKIMIVMKLVRKPRVRPIQRAVLDEVREEYNNMADDIIDELLHDVDDWKSKPKFTKQVTVSSRAWNILVKVDARTRMGKIWKWVNEGTGLHGPQHKAYPIYPKKARALHFFVPHYPKTLPTGPVIGPRIVLAQGAAGQGEVFAAKVDRPGQTHPGIRPRYFTESLLKILKSRSDRRGLKYRTDKAVKRGIRKGKRAK